MTRPSNRELKVLSHLGPGTPLGPRDFKDIGDKVFAGLLKKGWIEAVPDQADTYTITPKGHRVHVEEFHQGRFKH